MRSFFKALLIVLVPTAAGAQTIDVGRANWDRLPKLQTNEQMMPIPAMVGQLEKMLDSKQCTLPGQRAQRFDITVPYALFVEPDGKANRVLVAETGCEGLETMVGEVVLKLASLGHIKGAAGANPRWFGSEVSLTLQ